MHCSIHTSFSIIYNVMQSAGIFETLPMYVCTSVNMLEQFTRHGKQTAMVASWWSYVKTVFGGCRKIC